MTDVEKWGARVAVSNTCPKRRQHEHGYCDGGALMHQSNRTISSFTAFALSAVLASTLSGCADAELTQVDLTNADRLVEQTKKASKRQQAQAANWKKNADEAAKQQRWDLASKMYGEALLRYPSFALLKLRAEATARSDRKRDTLAETLAAQQAAFKASAETMRTALAFAEKLPAQTERADMESVKTQLACLESYDGGASALCEPVASVLKRYSNQRD